MDGSDLRGWVTAVCAAGAFAMVVAQPIFGAGGLWGHDTAQIAALQQQITGLSDQVTQLSRKIDAGPSLNQVQDMSREIGVLEGRLDGYDQRLRQVETDDAAMNATIQGIDTASRAPLRR